VIDTLADAARAVGDPAIEEVSPAEGDAA